MENGSNSNLQNTMQFKLDKDKKIQTKEILSEVYQSLSEKGYNPVNQMVGYLISGDPTYITNHKGARALIRRLERDEILEEVLKTYLDIK
ncbi:MAG: IreB family regulatory phosphoprotein [Clostridiaceae bacterium]